MEKIVILRAMNGFFYMNVCADKSATDDEIVAFCNRDNPSGTTNGWSVIRNPDKEYSNRAPVECANDSSRIHLMLSC